jgi:hypothetical protein
MSEKIADNKIKQKDNSLVDAIAAISFSCIFVATVLFWLSNK